jgi:hypothetical protein
MKKFELLNLNNCKTNQEVCKVIKERVLQISIDDLIVGLSESFVYHEEAVKIIYTALAMNNNSILYGPGGYAKSEVVKAVCNYLGIPLICKIGYKGMTPEELFGVPNMKSLMDESKYETAFENSVFCIPGVLCLEEGMDLSPQTAASLKDIITEKGFREGSNKKDSLISSIIITGNKDPEDESLDESIKAFYLERFPYRYNMVWKSHLESDYLKLFSTIYAPDVYEDQFKQLLLVAKVCEASNLQNNRISPRLSIYASSVALSLGVDFLDTITAFDSTFLKSALSQIKKDEELKSESDFLSKIRNEIDSITKLVKGNLNSDQLFINYGILKALDSKLQSLSYSDNSFTQLVEIKKSIDENLQFINSKMLHTDKVNNYIDNLFYKG